ncbi:MAG: thiamine phosphate synthase [Verrucomicrobiales bacterium]
MLYGIVDLGYVGRDEALAVGEDLLRGGVDFLQLRAKGEAPESLLELACGLAELGRHYGKPFVVNDHVELARECGADGVHLGQDDGELAAARAVLGEGKLVGRSTHSPEQARAALAEGADYIGFGPLFPTPTKEGRPAIGLEDVAGVMQEVGARIPVFCIGGIKEETLATVLTAGACHVVIVSALLQAEDIAEATRELRARVVRD